MKVFAKDLRKQFHRSTIPSNIYIDKKLYIYFVKEKEDVFDNIQTVITRFLDIDQVLSMCVQIPKQETLKTAEANINNIIYLKHILELVDPLRNALSNCENRLMKHFYKVYTMYTMYARCSLTFNI